MNRNQVGIKHIIIFFAALVYAGAVIYGDVAFLTNVSIAFPKDEFLRGLSYVGAVMTGATALLLPFALHYWFAPGKQFIAGILFWVVDVMVLVFNAMLAYELAIGRVNDFMSLWQLISPASPLLAIIGWGVMFLLDPSHMLRHAHAELEADQTETFATHLRNAANSPEVKEILTAAAAERAKTFAAKLGAHTSTQPTAPAQNVSPANNHQPSEPSAPAQSPLADRTETLKAMMGQGSEPSDNGKK